MFRKFENFTKIAQGGNRVEIFIRSIDNGINEIEKEKNYRVR
jgi:hypothetical protein